MENFDYFIAKQARDFFKEYDDRYDVLELLESEPKPAIDWPTETFYQFASEGSEKFISAWEEASKNMTKEELAQYDRGEAMHMIRDVELAKYVENCDEVSHIMFQAEKDIKEHILDNVPSLSENSFDERIIEFSGDIKKYRKNKINFQELFESGIYKLKITEQEKVPSFFKEFYEDVENYRAPNAYIMLPSKEDISIRFTDPDHAVIRTAEGAQMPPERTADVFKTIRNMLPAESDNIELRYTNEDNQITITESKEKVKIDCYEFEDIMVKDIHEVQKALNKDVTVYKDGIKNDIIYTATKNNKGNIKSIGRNGKVEAEMKSQRR